jgi:hypothetical protein
MSVATALTAEGFLRPPCKTAETGARSTTFPLDQCHLRAYMIRCRAGKCSSPQAQIPIDAGGVNVLTDPFSGRVFVLGAGFLTF